MRRQRWKVTAADTLERFRRVCELSHDVEQCFVHFSYSSSLLQVSITFSVPITTLPCLFPSPSDADLLLPRSTVAQDAIVPGPQRSLQGKLQGDSRRDCSFRPNSAHNTTPATSTFLLEEAAAPRPSVANPDPKTLSPCPFVHICFHFAKNASTTISWVIKGNWYDELQEAKLDFTRLSRDRGNLEVKYNMIDSDAPGITLVRIKADSEIYLCTTKNNFFLRAKI